MNAKPVQARVRKSNASSTSVLIRVRDLVLQTEYSDLVSCEFPIWTSAPIPVEIPPNGTKNFVVGPFSGSVTQERSAAGDFPNLIKFPAYTEQSLSTAKVYEESSATSAANQILTKVPFFALATAVSGVVDGKLVQTHCVVPLWNDGSAILVKLDWYDGEPAEGTPNPEWHLSASSGMPVGLGLEQLERASRLPDSASHCRYQLHVTPWLLGAQFLEDKGQATQHPIWQREWQFDSFEEFSTAIARITSGLMGADPARPKNAA